MAEPSDMAVPAMEGPYLARWNVRAEQRRWLLRGRVVTVGRGPFADVVLDGDPLVSRLHATLEWVGGVWTIVDDALSRNGTFVNGRRVSGRVPLHDRDQIRFGAALLTFCAPAEDAGLHTLIGEPLASAVPLTAAQHAVLLALCRPYKHQRAYASPATNLVIADELALSVDAVKTHLRVLVRKFAIDELPQNQKRARLAEIALQYGLVSDRDL